MIGRFTMTIRNFIHAIRGKIAPVWLLAGICIILAGALCIPVLAQGMERIESGGEARIVEEQVKPIFKKMLPDEVELTGMVYNIEVSIVDDKYECLVLLNIARFGTGMDLNQLLYITHPVMQRLFETAYISDKGIRVWARKTGWQGEMDGKTYDVYEVTKIKL